MERLVGEAPDLQLGFQIATPFWEIRLARISHKISGLDYKMAQKILNSNTLHDRLDFSVSAAY